MTESACRKRETLVACMIEARGMQVEKERVCGGPRDTEVDLDALWYGQLIGGQGVVVE
jgi:hypothetical protein